MRIITDSISADELRAVAQEGFGDMVKAVVDFDRGIMALGAELHSDEEAALLESGSDFIEFDAMINIRPSRGNRSRGVEDAAIRERIARIVTGLVAP